MTTRAEMIEADINYIRCALTYYDGTVSQLDKNEAWGRITDELRSVEALRAALSYAHERMKDGPLDKAQCEDVRCRLSRALSKGTQP